jgi:hypothetical protein
MPSKCPFTDKVSYSSQKQAEKAAKQWATTSRKGPDRRLRPYLCECHHWHLASSEGFGGKIDAIQHHRIPKKPRFKPDYIKYT